MLILRDVCRGDFCVPTHSISAVEPRGTGFNASARVRDRRDVNEKKILFEPISYTYEPLLYTS